MGDQPVQSVGSHHPRLCRPTPFDLQDNASGARSSVSASQWAAVTQKEAAHLSSSDVAQGRGNPSPPIR